MDIDFIIPWVDGNDAGWLEEKERYQGRKTDDSNSVNRFRDWGLLPYWFRSIERFTPWVHRIHFVTWGHVPSFLKTDHPKLKIVNHRDFIPNEYLPTFSSHVIETNIHRIPDLSPRFVNFNDDTFILRNMKKSDFFKDGLPCTCGQEFPIEIVGRQQIWQHAAVNDLGVVNAHFDKKQQVALYGKKYRSGIYRWKDNLRTLAAEKLFPDEFTGFRNLHAPAAYLKSTLQEVWEAEPELLHQTGLHRFRSMEDVNQWVFIWWQVASGNFSPALVDNVIYTIDQNTVGAACNIIRTQSHDMICINDPEQDIDFEKLSQQVRTAFEQILPDKCSFEV